MLYLLIGSIGLVLLAITLLIGDVVDVFDVDTPFLSGTAIAASLAGFGMTAAIVDGAGASNGPVIGAGLGSGVVLGALVGVVTANLRNAPTDATPNTVNVVGARGHAIGPVLPEAWGEVSVNVAGHLMKFNARTDDPIAAGTPVVVTASLSPTSVKVTSAPPTA